MRLIDADKLNRKDVNCANVPMNFIDTAPTVEAIPKDQYEARLKADIVAMLTDFLMDIEENTSINSDDSHERNGKRLMRTEIIGMFEQKINSLKEATDGLHT